MCAEGKKTCGYIQSQSNIRVTSDVSCCYVYLDGCRARWKRKFWRWKDILWKIKIYWIERYPFYMKFILFILVLALILFWLLHIMVAPNHIFSIDKFKYFSHSYHNCLVRLVLKPSYPCGNKSRGMASLRSVVLNFYGQLCHADLYLYPTRIKFEKSFLNGFMSRAQSGVLNK